MHTVEFQEVDKLSLLPGMLCLWRPAKKIEIVVKLREILPEEGGKAKRSILIELPGGVVEEVTVDKVVPAHASPPSLHDVPEEFAEEFSVNFGDIKLHVGNSVLFTDKNAFRAITGHTKPECSGRVAKIDKNQLIVDGSAMQETEAGPKGTPFMLAVSKEEIALEQNRVAMGNVVAVYDSAGRRKLLFVYSQPFERLMERELASEDLPILPEELMASDPLRS